MALSLKDRTKELTNTTGTGTLTLVSAPSGFRRFNSVLNDGDTTYYTIESGSQFEVGIGTYSANTLTRTTVLASSNANALINITAARSFVFIVYPADKATYKDGSGRIVSGAAGIVFSDASVQTTAATSPDLSPYLTISSAASTYLTQSSATTLLAAKADLVGGLIPSAQLPSYVDDVVEAANLAAFPGTGETGKIYVAIDTGYTYRWSGSVYVRINEVDLSSYLTSSTAASTYLPLAGGTLTGTTLVTLSNAASVALRLNGATSQSGNMFEVRNVGGDLAAYITVAGKIVANRYSAASGSFEAGETGLGYAFQGGWGGLRASAGITEAGNQSNLLSSPYGWTISCGATYPFSIVNGTNAQILRLYETYSSSTSFGNLQIKANAGAAYQIGSAVGSAGGSNRAIDFGHWNAASAWTSGLFVDSVNSRVGIGTNTPAVNRWLDIVGSQATGHGVNLFITNTANDLYSGSLLALRCRAAGNGGNVSSFGSSFPNYGLTSGLNFSTALSTDNIAFRTGSDLQSGTGVAARFFIAANGNIGINTQSPNSLFNIVQLVSTTGSPTAFTITGAAHTTLTTAEVTDGYFNAARTVNFGATGGTIASQRTWRFTAPTFTAEAATTLTTMSTVSISGPPVASTNVTGTNAYALNVESGDVKVNGNVHCSIIALAGATPYSAISMPNNYDLSWGGSGILFGSSLSGLTLNNFPMQGITNLSARDISAVNGTTATVLKAHGTWTSTTSYERINIKGKASANFEIGPENGSAGGTLRGLTLGCYPAGTATIVGWAQFRPNASTGALEAFYLGPIADSTATGGNARGTNSVDLQTVRTAATQVVVAPRSAILGGERNTIEVFSSVSVISGGYQNSITGFGFYSAIGGGYGNTLSGSPYSVIGGGRDNTVTTEIGIIPGGYGASTTRYCQESTASGMFAAAGDAQSVRLRARIKTTDATPTSLMCDGASKRITIPSGKIMFCDILIAGIKSDGSASACYKRKVAIKNVAGTTALVGTVEAIGTDIEDNVLTDVAITADNTNDALDISVTGIAAETWRWVAVVEGLEIAYGV